LTGRRRNDPRSSYAQCGPRLVREERETKTAKSRKVGLVTEPLMFLKRSDRDARCALKDHP